MIENKSVEDKLRSLYKLQLIDSKIDSIRNLQGELPLEVKDISNQIEILKDKLNLKKEEEELIENNIKMKQVLIDESTELHKKYLSQQKNVKNSREYDSLSKEIEYQDLEIQLAKKHIIDFNDKLKFVKEEIKEIKKVLKESKENLDIKKEELKLISSETLKEEEKLLQKIEDLRKNMEIGLLNIYDNIRVKVKNKLVVVPIKGDTAEGIYFLIPPQTRLEVLNRDKIVYDEYTGRIIIDSMLAEEVKLEIDSILN